MQIPAIRYGLSTPSTDWGRDGNALAIVGAVRKALKAAGYPAEALQEFSNEALSGDYNHVVQTALVWCDIDAVDDADNEYEDEDEDEDEVECAQCGCTDYPEEMKTIDGEYYCWGCHAKVEA